MRNSALAAALACAATTAAMAAPSPTFTQLGTYATGYFDQGGSEITAFDALSRRSFVVNAGAGTVDVLDLRNPSSPVPVGSLDLAVACGLPAGSAPNSVDAKFGLVAVAVQAPNRTDAGQVAFFSAFGGTKCLGVASVGSLPDMVTFSPDGRYVLVANEGEPSDDYLVDPEGSVSVIDLWRFGRKDFVRTADFRAWNTPEARAALIAAGVRIIGPNATVAQDLEPEYITVAGGLAYVTIQEANAIAVVDIANAKVRQILPLGRKDHSVPGNGFDASDRDSRINIANWRVSGLYQPDSIAALTWKGSTYLVTANEGDTRAYTGFNEEVRLGASSYRLDAAVFPDAAALKANAALGRLTVSNASGDTDGDGDFDRIDLFGARSISIWDASGKLVWDSADVLEQEIARLYPTVFNAGHTDNTLDSRSDNKGPEPEGVAVGQVNGVTYAFVGLERFSAIAVFNVSNPTAPTLVNLVTNRDFTQAPSIAPSAATALGAACLPVGAAACPNPLAGDLGPEGLEFVPARASPTGKALLIVGNEVSGTTTVWQIQ